MIFINHQKSSKAAKDYYTQHIAPGDGRYYTEQNAQQMKGMWHGRGAEMLQLSGEVKQEDFFRLCDNINPVTGEQLTARNDVDRRVMTDVTFDVPKSVTLAYELGGDDRILPAFRESVQETMAEMEANVQTRVRKNGADHDRTTGNLIWAEHIHRTARPVTKGDTQTVDPQLHAHATVFNATFDPVEKRWKAIQLGDIVRDKGYYQAAFHARLASKLKGFGYSIERDGNSFKLAGIDRATVDKFSQRHGVIKDEAERLGATDPENKAKIARRSREKKNAIPQSMEDLRREWDARLTPDERLALKTARQGWDKGDATITPDQAKAYAREHSFQRASTVSEKRLKEEALKYAVGSIRPEDVADIAQHPEVISETHAGQLMTTTKTVLWDELAFLQFAKDGQRKWRPFIEAASLPADAFAGLSEDQKKAGLQLVTSPDTVSALMGKAGAGKTTLMRLTRDVLQSETDQHVFAFAPSSQASRGVLAKEGFRDATTLATLLKSQKMQELVKGEIIWVDEAGQISSRDMKRLMDVVKKGNNRLILSGDYTQHSSVEAGDAFRLLEKEAGVRFAKLTEIRRQTEPGYKKAVEAIAQGSGKAAQKGFDELDRMGCVIEATGPERHSLLVADYLKATDDGKSALIIAPAHAEGRKLTEELRGILKARGEIGKERDAKIREKTGWTDAQQGDARNYEPGMVVQFTEAIPGTRKRIDGKRVTVGGFAKGESAAVAGVENGQVKLMRRNGEEAMLPAGYIDRYEVYRTREISVGLRDRIRITRNGEMKMEGQTEGIRVNNGDIYTVEGFTKEGDYRLPGGKIMPKDWGHFTLGYVDTSYASQGKTVDRVFIATGRESLPAANQQQWYVSASRGREQAKLYVDSKEDVRDAIARTGERLSAVELTHTKLRPSWRHRFHQSLERNRVGRFLKTRAAQVAEYWRGRDVSYG